MYIKDKKPAFLAMPAPLKNPLKKGRLQSFGVPLRQRSAKKPSGQK